MPLIIRKVQKALPGLAKFLGVESQGVLTMEASNLIQPVIEADDYLGPNKFAILSDPAVAPFGNIDITVPDKKFWRLKWASVSITMGAVTNSNAIIEVIPAESGGLGFQLNPPIQNSSTANRFLFIGGQFSGYGVDCKGVNARPGDVIRALLTNTVGPANSAVRLFVQYQELDL